MIISFSPKQGNRGFLKGKYSLRRGRPTAVIVHTTGGGVIRRWKREGKKGSTFDTAIKIYHSLTDAGPHYVVGQKGEVVQTCPDEYVAWHVGRSKSWAYWNSWDKSRWLRLRYKWWYDRWSFSSPVDLAGGTLWKGRSCNANTIGIEVVPPTADPTGRSSGWSPECWSSLRSLIVDICRTYSIPCRPDYVVGHADAHPISRTARGRPWDTTPLQFTPDIFEAKVIIPLQEKSGLCLPDGAPIAKD